MKRSRKEGNDVDEGEEEINCDNEYAICEVNRFNLDNVYDLVIAAATGCEFFAVDTEFTGLDSGADFKSKNIETRYLAFREMVNKYALLQFGMSFFRRTQDEGWKTISFTFNVVQTERYTVAPHSMVFLAEHGLSLTSVYKRGILFSVKDDNCKLKRLWQDIALLKKPLVMHNGLTDMMFLYNSFFRPLPLTCQEWVKAMSNDFPMVYDTKYIAEYVARDTSTYLQYLFRYAIYKKSVSFECVALPVQYQIIEGDVQTQLDDVVVCEQYARHGNCRNGIGCKRSHDVDYIIDVQESKKAGRQSTATPKPNSSAALQVTQSSHSAGFDAFATSVVFASYVSRFGKDVIEHKANLFYLMFHDRPFLFQASQYH